MVKLVVVDHHQYEPSFFEQFSNVKIMQAGNLEEFYKKARGEVDKDFDFVIADQDPDGISSLVNYYLYRKSKAKFACLRIGLKKDYIQELEKEGVRTIIAFDYFLLRVTEIEHFEEVLIINPVLIGLPNINASELVYRILPLRNKFVRNLSSIGTISDYLVNTAREKINETVLDNKELFPELLELTKENKLDKYNIFNSKFKILSEMFWAPYILKGREGAEETVKLILNSAPFGYKDLLEGSNNKAVQYLRTLWKELEEVLEKEIEKFEKNKTEKEGIIIYTIQADARLTSKFSSIISDKYENDILFFKSKSKDGKWKYSVRRRNIKINLGEIVERVCKDFGGNGGGHPEAAGAIGIKDIELFEKRLIEAIKKSLKSSSE